MYADRSIFTKETTLGDFDPGFASQWHQTASAHWLWFVWKPDVSIVSIDWHWLLDLFSWPQIYSISFSTQLYSEQDEDFYKNILHGHDLLVDYKVPLRLKGTWASFSFIMFCLRPDVAGWSFLGDTATYKLLVWALWSHQQNVHKPYSNRTGSESHPCHDLFGDGSGKPSKKREICVWSWKVASHERNLVMLWCILCDLFQGVLFLIETF